MSLFRQIRAVTAMNLRALPERWDSSCVVVIGIAGVVGVLVTVLGMATSLSEMLVETGHADRAIVLRNGANAEISSGLTAAATATIVDAPGIARTPDGAPAASVDMVSAVNLTKRADGTTAGVSVRGLSAEGLAVRPEVDLVEGRLYEPGLRELIAGRAAQNEFANLELGDTIEIRGTPWTVVGTFATGNAFESSLLTHLDTLLSAYRRTGGSSVTVLLESADAFDAFRDAVTTNPTLDVEVMREPAYYAQQSTQMQNLLSFASYFVGAIMAAGALFAALNTMYSAVASRSSEIATLRALGFGAGGVVVSVLAEALLLALIGALAGAGIAWLLFGGNTLNTGNLAQTVVYRLEITPGLVVAGVVLACAIGFLGGLFPALGAARQPVANALRSV